MKKSSVERVSRRRFLKGAGAAGIASLLTSDLAFNAPLEPPDPVYLPNLGKPRDSQSRLNVITILADSLRYDHVGFHGNSWIQTPNLDAFAAQSQVFSGMYAGGFPTVINRAELFTGKYMFHRIGWGDIPTGETVLAQVFNQNDYATGLVFDTWHIKDHGFSFDRDFQSWQWIRGQEGDRYRLLPRGPELPCSPEKLRSPEELRQYLRNTAGNVKEEDNFTAKTFQAAIDWLQTNGGVDNFYLHVDCFSPHEPWDAPVHYVDLYSPGYQGERVMAPAYAPPDYLSAAELAFVKAMYAAEISLVDHWLGVFLNALDTMALADNTVVLFCSDHGFLLGEHNALGKAWDHQGYYEAYPLYEEVSHVPLMIRVPQTPARKISALAQPVDIMPTVLDYAGISAPDAINGVSLRPTVDNPSVVTRGFAVSARTLNLGPSLKPTISVTDGTWVLIHGANHAPSALYRVDIDPGQQTDLLGQECGRARTLHTQFIDLLHVLAVPEDKIAMWSTPPCA